MDPDSLDANVSYSGTHQQILRQLRKKRRPHVETPLGVEAHVSLPLADAYELFSSPSIRSILKASDEFKSHNKQRFTGCDITIVSTEFMEELVNRIPRFCEYTVKHGLTRVTQAIRALCGAYDCNTHFVLYNAYNSKLYSNFKSNINNKKNKCD